MTTITALIPIRVQSEMNLREHWTQRKRRNRTQQDFTLAALVGFDRPATSASIEVRLTRIYTGRQRGFDDDNLAGAFKYVRDAVASWLRRDDGLSSGVTWSVAQERGTEPGVRIEITVKT